MHKFFVSMENINGKTVVIEGDDVKHIYKVLRLTEGDKVTVNNLQGKEYICAIDSITKQQVELTILEEDNCSKESPIYISLFQGLPKSSKMDLIVQKNTELGVSDITPIITKRVVVKTELKEFKKLDRWNRIALESSKQCKRSIIPTINEPMEFQELLIKLKEYDLVLVPYEDEDEQGFKAVVKEIGNKKIESAAIIIGPEGGFEAEEIHQLKEIGAYIITLGPRILRTETAGFTAVSLVCYELGDLGGQI
ncbi:16S rRNA (uracil1498-N3)-methyltransferase [Hathewaya proteolytica DSM 3090]|uniref:Ribosomal RNA small subunit methyltransferase E n=1 Tax=Hathewaya proteolytica DSM 3090 TaxID=1121331 RepID=A0A1M6JGI3_9CLOT|nr:16S rRNA (uracil(1498)-N(3))-methyltransferase [Hathewaya proteolytica]SHJ45775.1 16S rRNA (uracil1498-N3)-methyltransferase [Hathewaya proteolytica DSM 3090]